MQIKMAHLMAIVPLRKAPYRTDNYCAYCKVTGHIIMHPHLFKVNVDEYHDSVSINVPTCEKCDKETISIEPEYADLLVARKYLVKNGPVTGNAARQIRAIVGYTREEWADTIDASGADWVKYVEELPAVETGYALMLLGMVAMNIAQMES